MVNDYPRIKTLIIKKRSLIICERYLVKTLVGGIRIGRLKTRDSDLIRKLRCSGMTFREIAKIAKCSTAAVAAEVKEMKKESLKLDSPSATLPLSGNRPIETKSQTDEVVQKGVMGLRICLILVILKI